MRTIVDLPKEQIKALARLCRQNRISRAEAVRRAVEAYISSETPEEDAEEVAFGLWKNRVDGIQYQRELRNEWQT